MITLDTTPAQHTQINLDAFCAFLSAKYAELFANDPEYSYSASKCTPGELARKMALALDRGSANKAGKAIAAACRHFGIPHTYKAIRAFLASR
jgi:hypothetical protein